MLPALLTRLNTVWKAAALSAAIFGAGLTTGAAAGGLTKLPARVASVEKQANQLTDQVMEVRRDVMAIREANRQMLCLTISERAHTDWRKCLTN